MRPKQIDSQIGVAFFLNLIFTIIEFVGGFLTNSIAIYSNALHDLGDTLSLSLAYFFEKLSKKKRGKTFTYGYKRFSLLAALINSIILIVGSIFILSEAIPRLTQPAYVSAQGMVWLAILGVVVNGIAVLKVKGGTTMNARIVRWHLLEDVLSWAVILVIALVLLVKKIYILDPILSILMTIYIFWNVFRHLRETLMIFLQGQPTDVDLNAIKKEILAVDGVSKVHDMHIWSLDGEHHVLTTHLVIKKGLTDKEQFAVKCCIKTLLDKHAKVHSTLEIEIEGEQCDIRKTC